jgi:hypothetical protein
MLITNLVGKVSLSDFGLMPKSQDLAIQAATIISGIAAVITAIETRGSPSDG